ncbi:MAG TPA: bifunctional homocysteine S-methyltransferase/methylenetetrahydrofolate reductase [Ktedonobacterales bacterium]
MSNPFLERLRREPLLCDGAMGTQLYARGSEALTHGRCFDELVLTEPALVQTIHREYIEAGAQIVETNTFGANRFKLEPYGLDDRVVEINRRAAQLAREAREVAGESVFVAGAVGPSGQLQAPVVGARDGARLDDLRAAFREQIGALIEGGADVLMLETFSNVIELEQAVLAAREVGDLPIVAQVTFTEDGQTLAGQSPSRVARTLVEAGVDVLGCNCSVGPAGVFDATDEMRATLRSLGGMRDEPPYLSAQPNAGLPARIDQRFIYVSTPAYFADYARRFIDAGVRLVGGCCGTTPRHIAAMRKTLDEMLPESARNRWAVGGNGNGRKASAVRDRTPEAGALAASTGEAPAEARGGPSEQSRLSAALEAGKFVVSVELDPPKGLNPAKILDGATHLRTQGVEFINIADSPMARVRMSCLAMAHLLRDALDIEPIIHFTTRDRNLMALQSDLLGAHALGIRNILSLTGDPLRAGNYPNLTGVWNVDSVGLIRVLRGMNDGQDAAGAPLGATASFFIGAALNLNMEDIAVDRVNEQTRGKLARPDAAEGSAEIAVQETGAALITEVDLELERLRAKLDAGAHYIMTQPIYTVEPLERFFARFGSVPVPILLGMIPLHSSKHAEYLHNEVPGISIPDDVRARMRDAGERGREVGIELARDVIMEARRRGLIQGCYLMPSYGRYDLVGELAGELLR